MLNDGGMIPQKSFKIIYRSFHVHLNAKPFLKCQHGINLREMIKFNEELLWQTDWKRFSKQKELEMIFKVH